MLNIVLHEPEMPANTGNIGRTCVATGSVLHLIEPLGFRINDKTIKRAGLDYWDKLDVRIYLNYETFWRKIPVQRFIWQQRNPNRRIPMFSMKMGVISCLEKKARAYRKKSYWRIRKTASGFRCCRKYAL